MRKAWTSRTRQRQRSQQHPGRLLSNQRWQRDNQNFALWVLLGKVFPASYMPCKCRKQQRNNLSFNSFPSVDRINESWNKSGQSFTLCQKHTQNRNSRDAIFKQNYLKPFTNVSISMLWKEEQRFENKRSILLDISETPFSNIQKTKNNQCFLVYYVLSRNKTCF